METLTTFHAHMRDVLLLVAGLSTLLPIISVVQKKELNAIAKIVIRSYAIVITVQFLTGLTQLIMRWSDFGDGARQRLEHAGLMLLAVAIVHIGQKYLRVPAPRGPRNTAIMMGGSLIIMVLGIFMIQLA
ncbi:MAG: hypothetical protein HQ472_04730 [Ignavibacteria bacterium]|nr:hypothetical protein [Ignavibacteria bacterium]